MKFVLPINAVLNALKCTASNDEQHYLEGIHITKNSVEATNGHYLYQAKLKNFDLPDYLDGWKSEFQLPESIIIKMKQKIAKPLKTSGCEFVLFEANEKGVIAKPLNQFGEPLACYMGEVLEGKFPDCDRVIPSGEQEACEWIGFNSAYLKKLDEVSDGKYGSVKLKAFGAEKAALFEIMSHSEHYTAIFVLMPIRI